MMNITGRYALVLVFDIKEADCTRGSSYGIYLWLENPLLFMKWLGTSCVVRNISINFVCT